MTGSIQSTLHELAEKFSDKRLHIFDVYIQALFGNQLALGGFVLEDSHIRTLITSLQRQFPELQLDAGAVQTLRKVSPRFMSVETNLSSLHATPSFLGEMLTQVLYGSQLEVLKEQERWCFVRQDDGYLGWTYRPYLSDQPALPPTHLVQAPVSLLRQEPHPGGNLLSRLLGGTAVHADTVLDGWAQVAAHQSGWVPLVDLRSLDNLPQLPSERRATMITDGMRLLGVPYLWGGNTAHGIDCSGFAQLLHRWIGITLPRDADLQYAAGRPVEPPLQPGDLLFFSEGEGRKITHVAVSLGGWKIVHSSRSRNGVGLDDLESAERLRSIYVGARTFIR